MTALLAKIVLSYLLGSVSGGLLVGRLRKIDIRKQGSGNAGGTNAFRTQGLVFALGVVIIDIGKGFVAAWWISSLNFGNPQQFMDTELLIMACGLAAVVGHCFPIWHGFRGGKGAATAVGALIVIEPWVLLPLLVTWLLFPQLDYLPPVKRDAVDAFLQLPPGANWDTKRDEVVAMA